MTGARPARSKDHNDHSNSAQTLGTCDSRKKRERPRLKAGQERQQLRHQRPRVSEPVAPGLKGNNGDLEPSEVLLVHHGAVHRQQNLETLFGSPEQDTVLEAGPADEGQRFDRVAGEIPPEPPLQVFVQQDVHSGWLQ